MSGAEWQLVGFSLRMALASLLLISPVGLALAWWLARKDWRGKALVETLVSLPLVLPPVVTGLVLLQLFGRRGPVGSWLHNTFNCDVVFTWRAVVIALAAMSLPLFVRAARTAFEEVDVKFEQLARTLGAGEWRVFFTITLPVAIYQAVENGEDAHAWTLAGVSAVIAFAAVFISEKLQRRRK